MSEKSKDIAKQLEDQKKKTDNPKLKQAIEKKQEYVNNKIVRK